MLRDAWSGPAERHPMQTKRSSAPVRASPGAHSSSVVATKAKTPLAWIIPARLNSLSAAHALDRISKLSRRTMSVCILVRSNFARRERSISEPAQGGLAWASSPITATTLDARATQHKRLRTRNQRCSFDAICLLPVLPTRGPRLCAHSASSRSHVRCWFRSTSASNKA